ncbi:VOC family protein [Alcaligenaceae bacterium]|nr:VOC family protein [Alcaligenaceae bacterium]
MMLETSIGQPFGGIIQVAYVVEDLQESMALYAEKYGIGPWFLSENHAIRDARYRGQPTDISMSIGFGFSGHMCFELIQQLDELPSVYRDVVKARGYGFHHLGMACRDYDADLKKYLDMGYELAFSASTPRGIRFGYMDTLNDFPGMLELIEVNDTQEKFLRLMREASLDWDGADPIRNVEVITRQLV